MRPIPEFASMSDSLDVSKFRSAKRPYVELVKKAADAGKLDKSTFHSLSAFVRMPYEIAAHPESERLFFDAVGEFWPLPEGRSPVSDEEADFLRSISEWRLVGATCSEKVEIVRAKILQTLKPNLKEVMDGVYLSVDAVLSREGYRPNLRAVPAEAFGLVREDPLWCAWHSTRRDERGNYDDSLLHYSQDSAIRRALWEYGHRL